MRLRCSDDGPDAQSNLESSTYTLTTADDGCSGTQSGANAGYPVPAPDGSDEDYYSVTCSLTDTVGQRCTVSVLDQQDWGGCIDILMVGEPTTPPTASPVVNVPGNPTPSPIATTSSPSLQPSTLDSNELIAALEADTYRFSETVPIEDNSDECGYCGVTSGTVDATFDDNDPDSVTLTVALVGKCGDLVSDEYGMDDDYDFQISGDISLTRASGESSWKSDDNPFPIYNYDTEEDETDLYFSQDFQWVLTVDGIASWTNVDDDLPEICDGYAQVQSSNNKSNNDDDDNAGTTAAVIIVILLLIAGAGAGYWYYVNQLGKRAATPKAGPPTVQISGPSSGGGQGNLPTMNPVSNMTPTAGAPLELAVVGGSKRICKHTHIAEDADEMSMNEGDLITVVREDPSGWWEGINTKGERGIFPANHLADEEI